MLLLKKTEYYVNDGEHSEKGTNTTKSRTKRKRVRIQKLKYNSYNPKYEPTETKYRGGDFKRSRGLSLSSKIWVLCYCQTIHIKHGRTIFHMVDRCFPIQFLQAKRRELHTIRHEKTYSEMVDDPQIPQYMLDFCTFIVVQFLFLCCLLGQCKCALFINFQRSLLLKK